MQQAAARFLTAALGQCISSRAAQASNGGGPPNREAGI